jgi:glutathione synthase/RimK-type ligase-like ATP-grasp enzyme
MDHNVKRCAFLTTDNLEGFFVNDELAKPAFRQNDWHVEEVSWHQSDIDWNQFDIVIVRSTWDYQNHPSAFLACLERIEASQARLMNSLNIIRWNFDKSYMGELANKGVEIVPSMQCSDFDIINLENSFAQFNVDEIVIKPLLSANGDDTFRIKRTNLTEHTERLGALFFHREHIIQPYISSVKEVGEFSLFYFGSKYSHCITKTPQGQEFRCQEEHGGILKAVTPESALLETGQQVLDLFPQPTLYARIDFLQHQGRYLLIEAELIEPSLYFNMDEKAASRFVHAVDSLYG